MRQEINGYRVVRAMTIDGNNENTLKVQADGEFIYVPQVVGLVRGDGRDSERFVYYLEIPKRLLQIGVGTIDD